MIGTLKTVDIRALSNLTLTKVEMTEYLLKLYFGESRIDVEEYWEYIDSQERILDRQLSLKFRRESSISNLVDRKVVKVEYLLGSIWLRFDNGHSLKINSLDDRYTTNLDNYKAFGDNSSSIGYIQWEPHTRVPTNLSDRFRRIEWIIAWIMALLFSYVALLIFR